MTLIDILAALFHLLQTGDAEHLRLYLVALSITGGDSVQAWAALMLRGTP